MSDKRYLWSFYWDFGRSGEVGGLFVATEEAVDRAIGKTVDFGEVLGKHSDVRGTLGAEDVTKHDVDSETVEKVTSILGTTWSGYNPLENVTDDD